METTCPHCRQGIEIDAETFLSLRGLDSFTCPACSQPVPTPAPDAPDAPDAGGPVAEAMSAPARRRLHWSVIPGVILLVGLGAMGIWWASQRGPDVRESTVDRRGKIVRNRFFQDLIASGATTEADLEKIGQFEAFGTGWLGVSRAKLSWAEARILAQKTASHLLPIEDRSVASRQPTLAFIGQSFPDLAGLTAWAAEDGEPRAIESGAVHRVTTLERPRPVVVQWLAAPPKRGKAVSRSTKEQDIVLVSLQAPAVLSPEGKISLRVSPGESFTVEATVWYRTPHPNKLASNLLMKDVLPADLAARLNARHEMTWHFDTETRPGYRSVDGEGEIVYTLSGIAPPGVGDVTFKFNAGLFDKRTWDTEAMIEHEFTLQVAAPPQPNP